jgi:hypothetical protein
VWLNLLDSICSLALYVLAGKENNHEIRRISMAQIKRRHGVISHEDPWRWLTFSGFWGTIYYLLSFAGLIAGQKSAALLLNRRPALVSFATFLLLFISGGTLTSVVQQLIVGRSSKDQARGVIANGLLEPSIPLQALGGAAGASLALGLATVSNRVAERITGERVFLAGEVNVARALAVTGLLSGFASLAVSRIAAWVAEDAQEAERIGA